MNSKELHEQIFENLLACFDGLEQYKKLDNATADAKTDVAKVQLLILSLLSKNKVLGVDTKLADIAALKGEFVSADRDAQELHFLINTVLDAINDFGDKHNPGSIRTMVNFLAFLSPVNIVAPTPNAIQDTLRNEFMTLSKLQTELAEHIKQVEFLQQNIEEPAVMPRPKEEKETDASNLITITVLPHVEECVRIRFLTLVEYANCLRVLRKKLTGEIDNYRTIEFIDNLFSQVLQQLGIDQEQLEEIQNDRKSYLRAEEKFVTAHISAKDCLDVAYTFKGAKVLHRNMQALFKVLNENGGKNVALVMSLQQSFEACEKNMQLMRSMLNNFRYMRDHARSIKQKFDHVLLNIPMIKSVTLDYLLSMFGIKDFIRDSIKEFSYKELTDMVRVRMSLETHDLEAVADTVTAEVPKYVFEVDLGVRQDFSYGMQTYQTANQKKYALLCTSQMQLSQLILDTLEGKATADKKLVNNLQALRAAFAAIIEAQATQPYKYSEMKHRHLNEALSLVCKDFYPDIEQHASLLLTAAGNIQRSIAYKIFANDVGNLLTTNSAAYAYGQSYSETGAVATGKQFAINRALGGLEWGSLDVADNLGNNAAQLFNESDADISSRVSELYRYSQMLNKTIARDATYQIPRIEIDEELFKFTADIDSVSYLQSFINMVLNVLAIIATMFAFIWPKSKPKKSTNAPESKEELKTNKDSKIYKKELNSQLIRMQMEQQSKALSKALEVVRAMNIEATVSPLAKFMQQAFGTDFSGREIYPLSTDAQQYFEVLALQEAIKSIADPTLRNTLSSELNANVTVAAMTSQQRKDFIERATDKLAEHAEHFKIDAFYRKCKFKYFDEIATIIRGSKLSTHGIAANQAAEQLVYVPIALEAAKGIFVMSPFLQDLLSKFKQIYLYKFALKAKELQDKVFDVGLLKGKNKLLEIPASAKKAAEYFVYEHGKTNLDILAADRMIKLLKSNSALNPNLVVQQSGLLSSLYNKITGGNVDTNPYQRNKETLLSSMQEQATYQLVQVLDLTLKFADKISNKAEIADLIKKIRAERTELLSLAVVNDDFVRNQCITRVLGLLNELVAGYELQTDANCFEFLMILRFATENIELIYTVPAQIKEYMAYHGIADTPDNTGKIQKLLSSTTIGPYAYKGLVNSYSGDYIDALTQFYAQMPATVTLNKVPVTKNVTPTPQPR